MYDEWFEANTACNGPDEDGNLHDDGCHPDEAQALKDYCNKKTNAAVAARLITTPIENSKDPGANLHRLWNLLIDALVELPTKQILPLIQLLVAIQRLPEPDLTGRRTTNTPIDGFIWRGLPRFGHMWSDEHKQGHWRDTIATSNAADRAAMRTKHVRIARIEALLVIENIGAVPLDWGYECIADALERRDAVLAFEVPAAREWFIVAGQHLRAGAVDGRESWALWVRRDLWKHEKVMNLERWSFWKRRMEVLLRQAEGLSNAAR